MDPLFVVDAMLGTLAKWLRILGYDTLFDPALDDHQLVRQARAQGRILLTRDQELSRRRGVRTLLVTSETLDNQIKEVLAVLELEPTRAFSRCPVCNGELEALSRQAALSRVPAYVARTQDTFRQCPGCQRVYWPGTHWQKMDRHLSKLNTADAVSESESTATTNHNHGG